MRFAEVAAASEGLAATSSRRAKRAILAACLRRCEEHEVPLLVSWLAGDLPQRRTGLGPASLRGMPAATAEATLTVQQVNDTFERAAALSGAGAIAGRRDLLSRLLAAATGAEQRLLAGLVTGEVRHGALEGVMVDAVAEAAGVRVESVRRALLLSGSLATVASAALSRGAAGLSSFRLEVGRPVAPMLATPAKDVASALERTDSAALEWKLDGIRVQAHRNGALVRIFSRTLEDITARVPDLVAAVSALPVSTAVLDGEAIALDHDGRPLPFQVTGRRTASSLEVERARQATPLSLFAFDVLHADGEDLLDLPAARRYDVLDALVPEHLRVPRILPAGPEEAAEFLGQSLRRGHEGILVKDLDAAYLAGRRGAAWQKVKPRHTLDLVVLAVEWGHGRRRGLLSNLHLGARDPSGGFVMLGKTFKGLTDEMLRWQTERLGELALSGSSGWVVEVRPELVVEIAFDGVQASPRYPGGLALRFARVLRYRPDKRADQADTIDAVRELFTWGHTRAPGEMARR